MVNLCSCLQHSLLAAHHRALLYLFNLHTMLLAGFGCLAVYACDRWKLQFNMDFMLVATGTHALLAQCTCSVLADNSHMMLPGRAETAAQKRVGASTTMNNLCEASACII